jgi:hypothetical protein
MQRGSLRAELLRGPRHTQIPAVERCCRGCMGLQSAAGSSTTVVQLSAKAGTRIVRRWRDGLKRGRPVGLGSAPLDRRTGTATELRSVAPMSCRERKSLGLSAKPRGMLRQVLGTSTSVRSALPPVAARWYHANVRGPLPPSLAAAAVSPSVPRLRGEAAV